MNLNHAEEHRADLLAALIFDHGVRLLTAAGSSEANARSFLGKRIAEIGREPLALAIVRAALDQAADPRAYLGACGRGQVARDRSNPADFRNAWDDDEEVDHGPH